MLSGTPPTIKPGFRPACSTSMPKAEVVVVLPCVPVTTSVGRPGSSSSSRTPGNDVRRIPFGLRCQDLDMVAATDVADDDKLWIPGQVGFAKAREEWNSGGPQLGRHRRIDVLVGAADVMSCALQKLGHRTHARAANSDEMDLHVCARLFPEGVAGASRVAAVY